MEDLSDLHDKKIVNTFILCQLVGAGTGFPEQMSSYRTNFARLVDKAVSEYSSARELVLSEIDEPKRSVEDLTKGRYIYVHLISNELENCITTVRRLFNYFEKIKSDETRFPIDKILKKKVSKLENDVRIIRDLIHHLEKDIRINKLQKDEVIAPVLNEDATQVKLGKSILPTADLSKTIRYFHEFGLDFMSQKFTDQDTYKKI